MRANLMTQKELAKRLGVTQSYISKIEKGLRRIDLFELMEYCEATKISLTEFAQTGLPSEANSQKRKGR